MHVAVEGAQARLVVLPTDPTSTQAAMEFMARVDPPSEGVPMRQASTTSAYCSGCVLPLTGSCKQVACLYIKF